MQTLWQRPRAFTRTRISTGSLLAIFGCAGWIHPWRARGECDRTLGLPVGASAGVCGTTVAARKLATLDQLCDGRLAVHIISGGRDGDQAKDGDYVDHPGRYRRSAEYVDILRRVWTETHPFDHKGEFYKFEAAHADIRCASDPHIPIYGGGGSDAAVDLLSPGLDVFMLWGEPLADTAAFMARVRNAAKGRRISFSLSTRPILAETDDKAWDRARDILTMVTQRTGGATNPNNRTAENIGRNACWRLPKQAMYTIPVCGWSWRPRRARGAIRQRSSVRPIRWRQPCSNIISWARPVSLFAATIRAPTPFSTAGN